MNILIAARLAFSRIMATKTRSGLTMLGIIIGVMSLIALVSVAQGATSGIQDQFKGLGARNLNITGTTNKSITVDDVKEIEKVPGIEIVSDLSSDLSDWKYLSDKNNYDDLVSQKSEDMLSKDEMKAILFGIGYLPYLKYININLAWSSIINNTTSSIFKEV